MTDSPVPYLHVCEHCFVCHTNEGPVGSHYFDTKGANPVLCICPSCNDAVRHCAREILDSIEPDNRSEVIDKYENAMVGVSVDSKGEVYVRVWPLAAGTFNLAGEDYRDRLPLSFGIALQKSAQ